MFVRVVIHPGRKENSGSIFFYLDQTYRCSCQPVCLQFEAILSAEMFFMVIYPQRYTWIKPLVYFHRIELYAIIKLNYRFYPCITQNKQLNKIYESSHYLENRSFWLKIYSLIFKVYHSRKVNTTSQE